eukprot:12415912-Karenia_brevis.AAC.1
MHGQLWQQNVRCGQASLPSSSHRFQRVLVMGHPLQLPPSEPDAGMGGCKCLHASGTQTQLGLKGHQ